MIKPYFNPFYRLNALLMMTVWLGMFSLNALAVEVTATVDRNEISIEETLNLKLRYQGKNQSSIPDLGDLEKNFDILSQSRSNQFRSFNGQVEAWVEWSLVIAPKRQGTLLVPSFNIDGKFTNPIEINVNDAKPINLSGNSAKDIFLETEIDQQQVFVQQQVLLTLRLNTSLPVASINQRETLELPDAKVEEISEQRYNRNINGRDYAVLELVFAIYPQESGSLEIPVMTWEANIGNRSSSLFDLYSRQNSLRRLRSEAQTITVKPKPSAYTGEHWLPAKNVVLSDNWSAGFPNFIQGEPITRNITLLANGLTASQLPTLDIEYPNDINHYPEPAKIDEQKSVKGIATTSVQTQALLVTEPGQYTLPAVTLTWWNTETHTEEFIELPARDITVQASPNAAAPPSINRAPIPAHTPVEPTDVLTNDTSTPWVLFLLTHLITALAALFVGRYLLPRKPGNAVTRTSGNNPSISPSYKTALKSLELACTEKHDNDTYNALLKLSTCLYPNQPANLSCLKQLSDQPAFKQALSDLDQTLYQSDTNSPIDYQAILLGARELSKTQKKFDTQTLAPLNPAMNL